MGQMAIKLFGVKGKEVDVDLEKIQLGATFVIACYIYCRIAKLYGPNNLKNQGV
jgi:hypothetical protein